MDKADKRDHSLDVLKGIGILLVIWGHTSRNSELTSSFHMPLFFMAVGAAYVYSHSGWDWKKKMKTLWVPYFFFSVVFFLYWFFIESRIRPVHEVDFYSFLNMGAAGKQFVNIFFAFDFEHAFAYDVVLWFLPCLAVTHWLLCTICKYTDNRAFRLFCCVVLCPAVYYLCIHPYSVRLPFCAELSLLAVPFAYIGFAAYRSEWLMRCVDLHYRWILFALLSFSGLLYVAGFWTGVGFYNHVLPSFYTFYFASVTGTFIVWLVSKKCSSIKPLRWLGRNSLLLMCVHEPVKRIAIKVVSVILHWDTEAVRENTATCFVVLIIVVLVSIPVIELINRKIPSVLGKF